MGRVRSYHTGVPVLMHGGKEKAQNRYLKVVLSKNGNEKSFRIHRLVALAWVRNDTPEERPFVDHINGNYIDNRAENLRWVSPKENSNNPITKEHYFIRYHRDGEFQRRSAAQRRRFKEHPEDLQKMWEGAKKARERKRDSE